ncbi:hypothetical protein [Streptomyces sp. NPDC089919]|uniref:caspase, EACC1-associated type n=1 Tax=Streptomyces sp. NPDC089919 TaxID=3155188 RepID=UPI003436C448
MAVREALVIATSTYEDPRLARLEAPGRDAAALSAVLADESIGDYVVRTVLDQPAHVVGQAIERFFKRRSSDDQLLLYLSCHGIKDPKLQLYFAAANTDKDLLDSSSVPAVFLNKQLVNCNARRILVLLDCCYSGAFKAGGAKGDTSVHLKQEFAGDFSGTGVVVITATDELQQAWEGDADEAVPTGHGRLSVFTRAVVDGLATGLADKDGDGSVSVEDLYSHVQDAMVRDEARQTPLRWVLGGKGTLAIARAAGGTGPRPAVAAHPAVADPASPAALMHTGLTPVSAALRRTMGPNGRPYVVPGAFSSRDADEIIDRLAPAEGYPALGHGLAAALAHRMREQVRDGRASAVLVFATLAERLIQALERGSHPARLIRQLPGAFAWADEELRRETRQVTGDREVVTAVASGTGDRRLAVRIEEALHLVGRSGTVEIERTGRAGDGDVVHHPRHYPLEGRLVVPHGPAGPARELGAVRLLVCDGMMDKPDDLLSVLVRVGGAGRAMVVATGFEARVLGRLSKSGGLAFEVAGADPHLRSQYLHDLAVVTGARLSTGMDTMFSMVEAVPGAAASVLIDEGRAYFSGGHGGAEAVLKLGEDLRRERQEAALLQEYDRLDRRLARLEGRYAVLQLGGPDETAPERARHGLWIGRSALKDGVVPGAATALSVLGGRMLAFPGSREREATDVTEALGHALMAPLAAIADNSGADPGTGARSGQLWPGQVYDAVGDDWRPAEQSAVADPVAVPRELLAAVQEAAEEFLRLV